MHVFLPLLVFRHLREYLAILAPDASFEREAPLIELHGIARKDI
jgi:hypothetical protein